MSRGLGRRQRAIVDLLADEEAREGLPLSALLPVLGPDRSDGRRVVRSLVRRGDAEMVTDPETGERRLKLAFWTLVSAMVKRGYLDEEPDPDEENREHRREVEEAMGVVRAEVEEERRALAAREDLWEEPAQPYRRRWGSSGPNQLRVIAVLVRYAPDPQMGLPAAAVRRIACEGVEKANVLRAVRSLVGSGTLQRSRDGERLRLAAWRTQLLLRHVPSLVDPPLDDEKAEAVLKAFGYG